MLQTCWVVGSAFAGFSFLYIIGQEKVTYTGTPLGFIVSLVAPLSAPLQSKARKLMRYLSASDFIAGTLAISAMGILRDASENLMKMLRDLAAQRRFFELVFTSCWHEKSRNFSSLPGDWWLNFFSIIVYYSTIMYILLPHFLLPHEPTGLWPRPENIWVPFLQ